MRILVAEDAPDNRLPIQAYLRREPHQVDIAENGRVAVDKFIAHPYDLVFMDVQMPELDGLDATRMIREWERERGIGPAPIIALTASVLDEDVERSLGAGCTAHISKPVKRHIISRRHPLGIDPRFRCPPVIPESNDKNLQNSPT